MVGEAGSETAALYLFFKALTFNVVFIHYTHTFMQYTPLQGRQLKFSFVAKLTELFIIVNCPFLNKNK